MSEIVIVPGLAVRTYVLEPARALRNRGHEVHVLRPPGWHGAPADLERYGAILARQLEARGREVSVLIGLSTGTQAAAVAAAGSRLVHRLLLVSPTVDPSKRTFGKLLGAWLFAPKSGGDPSLVSQIPDWAHAGVPRILASFLSSLRLPIERMLPRTAARLTVVHAEHDQLGTAEWAARLASDNHGVFVFRPGAPHSWPIGDAEAFADFIEELLDEDPNQ